MKIQFDWNRPIASIIDGIAGKDAQLFLANEAKRLMDPYVPARNMVLAQNVRVYYENGQGVVHYVSPYAHYQYKGEIYVDPKTGAAAFTNGAGLFWSRPGVAKKPSGRQMNHNTFRHPLATSQWDKAMMTARKDDLTRAYQNYLNRRET